jgi:hypothetical protein
MTAHKILAAAALGLTMLTSQASAQCVDCAMFPNRDHLNNGTETPASKMGLEYSGGGAPVGGYGNRGANAAMESQNQVTQRSIHRSAHPRLHKKK